MNGFLSKNRFLIVLIAVCWSRSPIWIMVHIATGVAECDTHFLDFPGTKHKARHTLCRGTSAPDAPTRLFRDRPLYPNAIFADDAIHRLRRKLLHSAESRLICSAGTETALPFGSTPILDLEYQLEANEWQ